MAVSTNSLGGRTQSSYRPLEGHQLGVEARHGNAGRETGGRHKGIYGFAKGFTRCGA